MRHTILFVVIIATLVLNGCAAWKAGNQPPAKNLEVLNIGTERDYVRAELGMPISTSEENGLPCETYSFVDGYSTGTRISRVFLWMTCDALTGIACELIGFPIELAVSGTQHQERVCYKDGRVATVTNLKKD